MAFGTYRPQAHLVFFGTLILTGVFLIFWGYGGKPKQNIKETVSKEARARMVNASTDQELQKFSLSGFDEKGKRFWKLEGDTAKISQNQTVYLQNNVTLRLKDDTLVRTDRLEWAQGGGTLKTDAPVFVDHQNAKIKGIGAYGLPNQSFIQLNRNIEMFVNGNTTITCEGPMKIFYNENKTVFYRNVKVVDDRGVLTSRRMDVYFDNQEKKVTQIIALGDVSILRGSDTTHSQRAIYTPSTGSLRLEGNPEVTLHKGSTSLLDAASRN